MGMVLGVDGKTRAVQASLGLPVSTFTTVYVGLLQTMPSNYDGLSFASLATNEFPVNSNFYTGRKAVTFGSVSADHTGAVVASADIPAVSWTNNTGSTVTIAGLFVTNIVSGSSGGLVLWVGDPDSGTANIPNGQQASIGVGDMLLRVD